MKRNFREDLTVIESFMTLDGGGSLVQAPVPDYVRVEFKVKRGLTVITCFRRGEEFSSCCLTEDGTGLVCALPLSRQTIGKGRLCHRVIIEYPDALFPDQTRYVPMPEEVEVDGEPIDLVAGPGDVPDIVSIETQAVLLVPGESAYQLAVRRGFVGTEEEWLESLKGRPGDDGHSLSWDDLTPEQKESLRGERGESGGILYPTFRIDSAMHLKMDTHEDTGAERFHLAENGHLELEI